MIAPFEFTTTPLVVFGAGALDRLGEHAARLGRRACLVTGRSSLERSGAAARAEASLAGHGVSATRITVAGEPDTLTVDEGCRAAAAAGCDHVIGIGGGSALDAAKAIACLLGNGGEALDYLEVVGRGRTLERPPAPWIAVPTTAGTGSEATKNAVLAEPVSRVKASIRHASLLPRMALLDPTLTRTLPPEIVASSGLDALVQLVEPYVSRRAHAMVDPLALEGIRRASRALPRAFTTPADDEARAEMLLAAHWSGIALAHRGLGAAHAFAGPLGGAFPIPHGWACAATIPFVMETNVAASARDAAGAETIHRYADVARAMGCEDRGEALATARAGIEAMARLCRDLGAPRLSAFGVTEAAFPDLVERARRTSSFQANPVALANDALIGILERAL